MVGANTASVDATAADDAPWRCDSSELLRLRSRVHGRCTISEQSGYNSHCSPSAVFKVIADNVNAGASGGATRAVAVLVTVVLKRLLLLLLSAV